MNSSFAQIHKELGIYSQVVADWRSYASDVLIEHIVVNTEKLGGRGRGMNKIRKVPEGFDCPTVASEELITVVVVANPQA
ncbi:hypothetical protein TNCV_1744691 [Trichonephila clavipes]|nr:hypothetical protein TNCV_1744691 [Trichonephila clavipes]